MTTIQRIPLVEIPDFAQPFDVFSSIDPQWTDAFVNRLGLGFKPYGLPEELMAPEGTNESAVVSFKFLRGDEIQLCLREFRFMPRTHLYVNATDRGFQPEKIVHAQRSTLDRFMRLSEREHSSTVVLPLDRAYAACSPNLLDH